MEKSQEIKKNVNQKNKNPKELKKLYKLEINYKTGILKMTEGINGGTKLSKIGNKIIFQNKKCRY